MTHEIDRRSFIENAAVTAAAAGLTLGGAATAQDAAPGASQVYFTTEITPAGLAKVFDKIRDCLTGKVAIKLHTGEPHGPNILPIELIKSLQATIPQSTIVECNTLYRGGRFETKDHLATLKTNGWTFCPVDIMDADGTTELPVKGLAEFLKSGNPAIQSPDPAKHVTTVTMGKTITNYDSMLVYTHFKGHAMGGFGGSLKNIGIGCASGHVGKMEVHNGKQAGGGRATQPEFLERMCESGKAICDHFAPHIVFVNVLENLSVDCDCDAHGHKPTTPDIGILASTDILAIDQASIDLVYALPEADKKDLVERIESRQGLHQLEYMAALGMGSRKYDLVKL